MAEEAEVKPGTLEVKPKPYIPEETRTLAVDGAYIIFANGSYIISFMQLEPPLVTAAEAQDVKESRSICVARISLSPGRLGSILTTLQRHFQRTQQDAKELTGDEAQEGMLISETAKE